MKLILDIQLYTARDASASRQRARQVAQLCGFSKHDQTRLATAVSELARSATHRTCPGQVAFFISSDVKRPHLTVEVADRTWNTVREHELQAELAASFDAGMNAARHFTMHNLVEEGTTVRTIRLKKALPADAPLVDALAIADAMTNLSSLSSNIELSSAQQQNRHLVAHNDTVVSLNSDLRIKAESLLSADRRKDEFLAVLAHELRGPLSAITMAAGMMTLGSRSQDRMAHLGELITRQAVHMSRIVEDLLDVSRIVRNEVSIERTWVDLGDVARAAVEQLGAAAQRRRHSLRLDIPAEPVFVEGDRTRLVQVLSNLIGNSVRYTPEGGDIQVEVAADTAKALARMSVSDNGIGISAELLPHLFELFTQAQRSSDSRNSGLGLGLALVKTLVEAHGGAVDATSGGSGQGSRFDVTLPAAHG